ncbi:hypothetical protein [Psychromonas algicola]|uniref:hypothetical protein n=1 Tax=Psychromonas algicola TaxID=2555642 RepID=UPI001067B922|nr:hypothetical protein [Psychromonas sp. RZ5]TEW45108.1 hypothetical protein E2R67_14380 [Psychromonas sp. RZ5]
MVDKRSSMLSNIFSQFVPDEDALHDCWAQLVLKYDRENSTAKLYIPAYTGIDGCKYLQHPLIQSYTTLKAAFDKEKKDKEALNLESPRKVFDLVSDCSYATVNQKIAEDELHNFLTEIKGCFNFPEQKYLGEIGDFSYYWLGQYVELKDWADQDNRWNAFEFEQALTIYLQDFIKHYCEHGYKQVNEMQPTINSLGLWMAESIMLTINESFAINLPFLDYRGEDTPGLFNDFVATAITIRAFFQLPAHLKEYINVDVNMQVDSEIYGPTPDPYNKRDNDLIDIARNSSLDLVSYLEQWSAYIDAHPDCFHDESLEYAAYLKHASQNPTAIKREP